MEPSNSEGFGSAILNLFSYQTLISWLLVASVFAVILTLALFVIINGRSRLEHGYSGVSIRRWSTRSIVAHWLGAIPCLFLIVTGLVLGAGKTFFDTQSNSWGTVVNLASDLHEFMAFPFMLGGLAMILMWWQQQRFVRYDLDWFKQFGGYINSGQPKHPDAGFSSGGEKLWFWVFSFCFLVLSVTGLMLFFPAIEPGYSLAPIVIIAHIGSAMVLGAFAVVHIFMAAIMSEGAMGTMINGHCDSNWAKQHHNRWFETIKKP